MDVAAVDLFCGVGGLTYGLRKGGLPVVAGIDVDPDCRYPYEENNTEDKHEDVSVGAEFVEMDLSDIDNDDIKHIESLFGDAEVRVLAGCAPCQPFSPYNHGGESANHEKWGLLKQFATIIEELDPSPHIVTMENVYEVRRHDVYNEFTHTLDRLGYQFPNTKQAQKEAFRVYCPEYGVPQKRKRWVLLASRLGEIELEDPIYEDESEYPTVRDAIADIMDPNDPLPAGGVDDEDPLHKARNLEGKNPDRISISEPGETWELWVEKGREDLLLKCHQKENGRSYTDQYGRMKWEEPAPTITTQFFKYGTGRFGHPGYEEGINRALSVREGALLQTFPANYKFSENHEELGTKRAGEFIGNAVPPALGEVIGRSIMDHIKSSPLQVGLEDYSGPEQTV